MKKGHVFTVEPMINLGSYDDITWGKIDFALAFAWHPTNS